MGIFAVQSLTFRLEDARVRTTNLIFALMPLVGCRAEGVTPQGHTGSAPTAPGANEGEQAWNFVVKPYLWAAGLDGDMQVGSLPPAEVDLGITEIIEDLDFTLMVGFEARKSDSDWALLFDVMYVRLKDEGQISEVEVGQTMIETGVSYQPGEQDAFEVLGGLRYWRTDVDVDLLGLESDSDGKSWIDPFIGGRAFLDLAGAWSLLLQGDVGGFGVGSEFTYQAQVGVRYAFGGRGHLLVGYRHLYFDYDEPGFKYDAALSGPLVGMTWSF